MSAQPALTIAEILGTATATLAKAGISSARLDAELLLTHVIKKDRVYLMSHSDKVLTTAQTGEFDQLIRQRAERYPLVHLIGSREFYGLTLEITPSVLTPRVETEIMAAWAIETAPRNSHLLDIGTGSGAIALAVAAHRPDLKIWATEVSAEALAVAQRNAAKHKLNINFVQSDLWENLSGPTVPQFETIVTNLPYLKDNAELMPEVAKEPVVALLGGEDGLELYRRFFAELAPHLAANGYVLTECDPWQQSDLIELAQAKGLSLLRQDYFILEFGA